MNTNAPVRPKNFLQQEQERPLTKYRIHAYKTILQLEEKHSPQQPALANRQEAVSILKSIPHHDDTALQKATSYAVQWLNYGTLEHIPEEAWRSPQTQSALGMAALLNSMLPKDQAQDIKALQCSPRLDDEKAIYATMLLGEIASENTLIGFGPPRSWFYFKKAQPPVINMDIGYGLLLGLQNARAILLHEISHKIISLPYDTPQIQTLNNRIQEILKNVKDSRKITKDQALELAKIKNELHYRHLYYQYAEDCAVSLLAETQAKNVPQDIRTAALRNYTVLGVSRTQHNEESSQALKKVLQAIAPWIDTQNNEQDQETRLHHALTAAAFAYPISRQLFNPGDDWQPVGTTNTPEHHTLINELIVNPDAAAKIQPQFQMPRKERIIPERFQEQNQLLAQKRYERYDQIFNKHILPLLAEVQPQLQPESNGAGSEILIELSEDDFTEPTPPQENPQNEQNPSPQQQPQPPVEITNPPTPGGTPGKQQPQPPVEITNPPTPGGTPGKQQPQPPGGITNPPTPGGTPGKQQPQPPGGITNPPTPGGTPGQEGGENSQKGPSTNSNQQPQPGQDTNPGINKKSNQQKSNQQPSRNSNNPNKEDSQNESSQKPNAGQTSKPQERSVYETIKDLIERAKTRILQEQQLEKDRRQKANTYEQQAKDALKASAASLGIFEDLPTHCSTYPQAVEALQPQIAAFTQLLKQIAAQQQEPEQPQRDLLPDPKRSAASLLPNTLIDRQLKTASGQRLKRNDFKHFQIHEPKPSPALTTLVLYIDGSGSMYGEVAKRTALTAIILNETAKRLDSFMRIFAYYSGAKDTETVLHPELAQKTTEDILGSILTTGVARGDNEIDPQGLAKSLHDLQTTVPPKHKKVGNTHYLFLTDGGTCGGIHEQLQAMVTTIAKEKGFTFDMAITDGSNRSNAQRALSTITTLPPQKMPNILTANTVNDLCTVILNAFTKRIRSCRSFTPVSKEKNKLTLKNMERKMEKIEI